MTASNDKDFSVFGVGKQLRTCLITTLIANYELNVSLEDRMQTVFDSLM